MKQIKEIIPGALAQLTKAKQASTKASAKLDAAVESAFAPFQTCDDGQLATMKAAAVRFASDLLVGTQSRWLTLLGPSGVGKTMLTRIVAGLFRAHRRGDIVSETRERIIRASGGFIKWATLVQWLRDGDYRAFGDVADDWFVCVDDIGSEHITDFSSAKLYEMFDRGEHKWRVWNANLSLRQIAERFDPRIASRMLRHGSVVVEVDAPDFNTRKS